MFSTKSCLTSICKRYLRYLSVWLCCLLVSACASNIPFIKSDKERESLSSQREKESLAGAESAVDSDIFVVIPNPYVEDTSAVPRAARKDFESALALMAAKKYIEAETVLLGMTELYPDLSGVYTNLGIVYHKTQQLEESEKALKFSIQKNKFNFDAYTVLGLVYREQGKFGYAESLYLSALGLWPHHPESRRNLGILYDLYMGKWPEALEHYRVSQQIAGGEDRELKGWIIDLERRLAEFAPKEKINNPNAGSAEGEINE